METKEIQEKARHFLEGERNASGQAGHTEQIEILDYLLTLIRGEQEVVYWVFETRSNPEFPWAFQSFALSEEEADELVETWGRESTWNYRVRPLTYATEEPEQ